jgi:hypothetical protein
MDREGTGGERHQLFEVATADHYSVGLDCLD